MSNPWPLVPLGEILTERQEVPPPDAIASGEIPIVSKIGFGDGKIQLRSDGQTRTGMIRIQPGDLVISGINAAKGAIAIYGEENTEPIAATIHYGAYIPNKTRADVKFLWWLLRSHTFRDLLLEYVPGGIKTELKAKRFLPIPVPLPLLPEQQRIVTRIEELAAKVHEARTFRQQAIILSSCAMESFIESIMVKLPLDGALGDVLTFKPRSGPAFVTSPDWDGTPVLMPSSVTGFGVDTSRVEFGLGNEQISSKDRLLPGDIIIARGNKRDQVGNAGVVPPEAEGWVCANLLMRMRLDERTMDPYFCIYWLRSPRMRAYVTSHMTGTNPNIQKINQKTILGFPFPTKTPLAKQRRIVVQLDGLQAEVDALKQLQAETATELNALLSAVLDKAFKGEL